MPRKPRRSYEGVFPAGGVTRADKATLFAMNVAEGRLMASKHVRASCERHMADLEDPTYLWRPGYENGHMGLFTAMCDAVPVEVKGGRIQPMKLDGWQHFVIASILGWHCGMDDPYERLFGTRRFNWATIMAGKSAGKTQLLSCLGIFMLALDYYEHANGTQTRVVNSRCYAIASTKEQVQELVMEPMGNIVDDSDLMTDKDEGLGLEKIGGKIPERIYHPASRSRLRAVGSRAGGLGKSGLIVHYVHAEELHEWPHSDHLETLVAGQKNRVQPLVVTSTNAGKGKKGYVWEEYRNAMAAAKGEPAFDRHFSFLAEVDEDAPNARDPQTGHPLWFPDRPYWVQAVPSIGSFADEAYIIGRVTRAKTEMQRNEVLRLNFGRWGTSSGALFDPYLWDRAQTDEFEVPAPDDGEVFVGIDMGRTSDMTAVGLVFRPAKGLLRAMVRYWVAGDAVTQEQAERLSGDLLDWIKEGKIFKSRIPTQDYLQVGRWLAKMLEGREAHICADPRFVDWAMPIWRNDNLPFRYEGEFADGWEIRFWPQNNPHPKPGVLSMDQAIEALEMAVTEFNLEIERNAVLDWNLACTEVRTDRNDMRILVRAPERRDSEKIDGIVALVMAAGLEMLDRRSEPTSFYDDPGFSLNS